MAELLDALRTPEPDLTPPPADDVRRRGDRLRRRRRTWQVAGAAAAVAVAVGGGSMLGSGDNTPRDLPITRPSTTPAVRAAIPSGLPITSGWPGPGPDGTVRVGGSTPALGDIPYCGRTAYPVAEQADRLTARYQASGDFRTREVTTYADVATARRALTTFRTVAGRCPGSHEGPTAATYRILPVAAGDESFAVLASPEDANATGIESIVVARIGNALVVSTHVDDGSPDQVAPQAETDGHDLAALLRSLSGREGAPSSDVLTLDGAGDLRLGTNHDDLVATGQLTVVTPVAHAACDGLVVNRWGRLENEVDGFVSHRYGLAALFARPDVTRTAEGIRVGSSEADLRAAYPTAEDVDGGRVRLTDADHPGRNLTFTVEDGKVTGFVAALDNQDCYD
jgi:hypothetical protein